MNLAVPARPWRGAILALAASIPLLLPVVHPAYAVPPGGPKPSHNGATVTLRTTKARPGGKIGVSGRKFPAGKSVTVKLDDDKVGVVAVLKVGHDGRFSGSVTIPRNVAKVLKPGRHHLRFLAPASTVNHQSNTSVEKSFTLAR